MKVEIALPDFPVTLNGNTIDNAYRQYPLITYKNMTYFPLTYNDCRFLGITTKWDVKNGLQIKQDIKWTQSQGQIEKRVKPLEADLLGSLSDSQIFQ